MIQRFRHSAEYRRMTPSERWKACQLEHYGVESCWIWSGVPNKHGYGTMKINGKSVLAHRFGYVLMIGAIPEGKQIDHLCRNRLCVNPYHLEPVDSRTNTLRGDTLASKQSKQTHCIHGHPFCGDNLRIRENGKRICAACNKQRCKAWNRSHSVVQT